jgi:hypothetical protein
MKLNEIFGLSAQERAARAIDREEQQEKDDLNNKLRAVIFKKLDAALRAGIASGTVTTTTSTPESSHIGGGSTTITEAATLSVSQFVNAWFDQLLRNYEPVPAAQKAAIDGVAREIETLYARNPNAALSSKLVDRATDVVLQLRDQYKDRMPRAGQRAKVQYVPPPKNNIDATNPFTSKDAQFSYTYDATTRTWSQWNKVRQGKPVVRPTGKTFKSGDQEWDMINAEYARGPQVTI